MPSNTPLPFEIPKTANESFRVQVDRQPHFYDHLHSHPEIQLTLIVASEGVCSIAHQVQNFEAGQIYLIGSDVPHVFRNGAAWYEPENEERAHSISLFFHRNSFGEGLFDLPEFSAVSELLEGSQRGIKLKEDLALKLAPLILEMPHLEGATRIIRLMSMLNTVANSGQWIYLSTLTDLKRPKEADFKRLNDILAYILENYQSPIDLAKMASVAHLTPSAFCRFFKKRTRKSFVEYLNEFRVSMACKLLVQTDLAVAQICFQTGFNNLANFNRQFRRVTGLTPTRFRKLNQKAIDG